MDITKLTKTPEGKIGPITLIRQFFGNVTMADAKALTEQDKVQLGTAIAKQEGVPFGELSFETQEY